MDSENKRRYSRQIAIESFGEDGQLRLMKSSVLIVGCGALGSMVAIQLAGAGVGRLGISDFDTIDISNLQRQFFFDERECGLMKAEILSRRISAINPSVSVTKYDVLIDEEKAIEIFPQYDFIVDATDNPCSKNMIEKVSCICQLPCCVAGVSEFHGQVMTLFPGDKSFTDVFSEVEEGGFLPCSLGGVIGPAAALCASIQTSEVIKYLIGVGECLHDRLLTFDLLTNNFRTFII